MEARILLLRVLQQVADLPNQRNQADYDPSPAQHALHFVLLITLSQNRLEIKQQQFLIISQQ